MERTDLGKGRFLITHTSEEIKEIQRLTKMSMQLALKAVSIIEAESSGSTNSNSTQVAESKPIEYNRGYAI